MLAKLNHLPVDRILSDLWYDPFGKVFNDKQLSAMSFQVDISETPEAYVFKADMPGVTKDQIDVRTEGDVITISCERSIEKGSGSLRQERKYGKCERSFRLVDGIDTDKSTAALKDGVLTLTFEKTDKSKSRKLEIKSD